MRILILSGFGHVEIRSKGVESDAHSIRFMIWKRVILIFYPIHISRFDNCDAPNVL